MTNNNTGIRVKENKGRAYLLPSLIITIFHLSLTCAYLQPCRDRVCSVCCRSLVLFSVVLTRAPGDSTIDLDNARINLYSLFAALLNNISHHAGLFIARYQVYSYLTLYGMIQLVIVSCMYVSIAYIQHSMRYVLRLLVNDVTIYQQQYNTSIILLSIIWISGGLHPPSISVVSGLLFTLIILISATFVRHNNIGTRLHQYHQRYASDSNPSLFCLPCPAQHPPLNPFPSFTLTHFLADREDRE